MANIKGPTLAKSSPHSSDEASHNDTPSTNLTAFSPESASTATGPRPKFNIILADADAASFNFGGNVGASSNDPFINLPTPTSSRSQLSPTADVFTPGQYIAPSFVPSSAANNGFRFPDSAAQSGFAGYPVTHRRARYGAIGDHPKFANLCHGIQSMHVNASSPHVQNFRDATLVDGAFTTDEATTRAFMVTNVSRNADPCRIAARLSVGAYPSLTGVNHTKLFLQGKITVGFTDYRDAKAAYANAQEDHPQWRLVRLSPKAHTLNDSNYDFSFHGRVDVSHVSDFQGQVIVTVMFNGRDDTIKAHPTFEMLKQALSTFGEIKAFHSLPYQQGNVREIRVEYFDTRHAENAARNFHTKIQLGPIMVSVEHYQPDVPSQDSTDSTCPSATGRSTVPFNDPAAAFNFPDGFYIPSPRNDRCRNGRYDAGGNHNQVEIYRIQLGLDVRTTIMLRNIPNKVNQAMLKMILDKTSRGRYDFMYLRIDFANNCNVGYAFINFNEASAIIEFALSIAGKPWNAFNSDKIAEISYATIQGKDCLVQKFRNSSVMLECPTFRPKLFITGNGPDAGEEEPFPPPDNPSKMRRSVENAEHVGLFAPRQGQMYREEQRRRRSQYDRGTPGAEFEAHTQHLTDPALSAYPSSSYAPTMNTSHYNNFPHPQGVPGPSTWYYHDY